MLPPDAPDLLSDFDRHVFALTVPDDHYLRLVAASVDFERFRPRLAEAYSPRLGRPPIDPVRMLKLLYLCYHYKLSDRGVLQRARTDMAFRWFLGMPVNADLPDPTDATHFRQRLGSERFLALFQDLLAQAREAGLVKDRLRLKDATHIFANVADLRPLQLAAQVRERLLAAAALFFPPDWLSGQRAQIDALRQATAEWPDNERLAARVEHLRGLVVQLRQREGQLPPATQGDRPRQHLRRALEVADKLLADQADPEGGDRLFSAVDPEARVGKHGEYFAGYLLDLAMDPDSELITAVNVLPGNGPEAADAAALIAQEEQAQGNDVASLSMDGIGYNGPVLRELSDPGGLGLDVSVPAPQPVARTTYGPERFSLRVIDEQTAELTCPNGQSTRRRRRNRQGTSYRYEFRKGQCGTCPLRGECLQNPASRRGRVVDVNDYAAEYRRVEEKARSPQYERTRAEHRKVERKLGEVARHHGGRHARYWGQAKVLIQAALTALVVNVKRMIKLVAPKVTEGPAALTVRAELGS
jgi:transposase